MTNTFIHRHLRPQIYLDICTSRKVTFVIHCIITIFIFTVGGDSKHYWRICLATGFCYFSESSSSGFWNNECKEERATSPGSGQSQPGHRWGWGEQQTENSPEVSNWNYLWTNEYIHSYKGQPKLYLITICPLIVRPFWNRMKWQFLVKNHIPKIAKHRALHFFPKIIHI